MQNSGLSNSPDRRRDAERQHRENERRRTSQQPGAIILPSPALVRHGSRQRKIPAALTPGNDSHVTPRSAAAHANVPVGTLTSPDSRLHPYAQYAHGADEYTNRASPMLSSMGAAPPAVSNVRATGMAHGDRGQDMEQSKPSLWKILICRAC
jgi:casein kinase 1